MKRTVEESLSNHGSFASTRNENLAPSLEIVGQACPSQSLAESPSNKLSTLSFNSICSVASCSQVSEQCLVGTAWQST